MFFRVFLLLFPFFALGPLAAGASWQTSPRASVLVVGGAMMNGDQFSDPTLPTMREHFAGCKQIALVLHASHPAERDAMEARMKKAFAHLGGIEATSVHRFDDAGARELLRKADGIWVGGGETFVLLAELYRAGQLELIRERVRAGVPFGGSSAGANVAGLVIGTTNDFPTAEVPTRGALAIFPAVINPHHPTPQTKADYDARVGKLIGYIKFNPSETVLALANASMVRLNRGKITVTSGSAWIYQTSGVRALKVGDELPELWASAGRK